MYKIGIDPGNGGAIAICKNQDITIHKNSKLEFLDRVKLFTDIIKDDANAITLIERQWVKPSARGKFKGGPQHGNKASWELSKDYTTWLNAMLASNMTFKFIAPQVWMKHLGTLSKDYTQRKREIKEIVSNRITKDYPNTCRVTLINADALALVVDYDYLCTVAKIK